MTTIKCYFVMVKIIGKHHYGYLTIDNKKVQFIKGLKGISNSYPFLTLTEALTFLNKIYLDDNKITKLSLVEGDISFHDEETYFKWIGSKNPILLKDASRSINEIRGVHVENH